MDNQNQVMDNNSYNLIMALASNLEALEAYRKYSKDGNEQLWNQLIQGTTRAINLLQQELPRTFNQGSTGQTTSQSQGTSSSFRQ